MPPILQKMAARWAEAGVQAARATCVAPFGRVAATPLAALEDHFLAIATGMPALTGGTGSAVILGPGLAVTNAHVLRGRRRVRAFDRDGPVVAEVVAESDALDLAVLAVGDRRRGGPPPIAAAVLGEAVWAMGATASRRLAPVARGWLVDLSAVAATDAEPWRRHEGMMYAAPAGPGYSGGPVVDSAGRLVGITTGVFTRLPGCTRLPADSGRPLMFAYRAGDVLAEMARLVGRHS